MPLINEASVISAMVKIKNGSISLRCNGNAIFMHMREQMNINFFMPRHDINTGRAISTPIHKPEL